MASAAQNFSLPEEDLQYIFRRTESLWSTLQECRVFMTGSTGFFGCWMLQSLLYANETLNLGIETVLLVRSEDAAVKKYPFIRQRRDIILHEGDISSFSFPNTTCSHIIHLATTASSPTLNTQEPLTMFNTIVHGTEHLLEYAKQCGAKKVLFVSSGAVYGHRNEYDPIREANHGAPDPTAFDSAYAEGKRAAEFLCSTYARTFGIEIKIARCFSFYGPCMQIYNQHAFGNFIADVLHDRDITIKSDGRTVRSYMYAADMAIWLWHILIYGETHHPYNVGSDRETSLEVLAKKISDQVQGTEVLVLGRKEKFHNYYVPSTQRIRNELDLTEDIGLEKGIEKTLKYFRGIDNNEKK